MSSDDPYLELIDKQWHNIAMLYESFKDKKPIIEYDVTHVKNLFLYRGRIYPSVKPKNKKADEKTI